MGIIDQTIIRRKRYAVLCSCSSYVGAACVEDPSIAQLKICAFEFRLQRLKLWVHFYAVSRNDS